MGKLDLILASHFWGVKGGDGSTVLTFKLSLELLPLSSVGIHNRMANLTQVSVFPAAPNPNSVAILRQEHSW